MAEWISVKDRLPEENGRYLCCYIGFITGNKNIDVLYFSVNLGEQFKFDLEGKNYSGFCGYDSEEGYFEMDNVTHWMPLPEPPKGE